MPRKHWSCKSQWHQCTDTLRKHPSRSIYNATPNRQEPILWKSQWQSRTEPPGAQRRPRAPEALLQSLDTAARAGPAATTRAAGPSIVSGHCGLLPSLDIEPPGAPRRPRAPQALRRQPFCSLWTLRREPAQRRPRAPQALLQSLDTAETAGPAATTRAAGPCVVSGHCGESRPSGDHARRRPFCSLSTLRPGAPQALLQSLDTAGPSAVSGHCGESRPSGDHARRRPFCSLWTLRREPATAERAGPAATTRAAGPSPVSGHCGESRPSGDQARRRPFCNLWTLQALLQSLDTAERAGHCRESRPSGDHARRRPFCSLWTLRREPAQRRPGAPQALLQSLDTAGPSAVSGHCGESRPSGDHARRRPFCSLWTLRREPAQRRPRAPQTLMQPLDTVERAGPAATTRAAGPSAVSGHCGESRPSGDHARHRPFCSLWTLRREPAQRRPRAPQALLQSLDTAERAGPAATTRATGPSAVSGHCGESRPSGDHARRRPFCSLWTLQALLQSRQ